MTHLQLRRQQSNERVLPVYYSDNYVSLVPNRPGRSWSRLQRPTFAAKLHWWPSRLEYLGHSAVHSEMAVALNENAQVDHWPVTGQPVHRAPMPGSRQLRNSAKFGEFNGDERSLGGNLLETNDSIDTTARNDGSEPIYGRSAAADSSPIGSKCSPFQRAATTPSGSTLRRLCSMRRASGNSTWRSTASGSCPSSDVSRKAAARTKPSVKQITGIVPNEEAITILFRKGSADQPTINAIEIVPTDS